MTRPALIAAAMLFPHIAMADTVELSRPMQAASLHDGSIDMVVYYLDHDDHFEVVATYAAKRALDDPNRVRMALSDGDATRFSMPGERQVIYAFSRDGNVVNVTAELTGRKIANLVRE